MNRTQLLAACRRLPHATEDIKWKKDLVFSVGGKMFAVFCTKEEGQVSFKTTPSEFTALTQQPGVLPAPYAARFHWVLVTDAAKLPTAAATALIKRSYDLVLECLPARRRATLGSPATTSTRKPAARSPKKKPAAKPRSRSRS